MSINQIFAKITLRIKKKFDNPEYQTLLEKADATHLISEVVIGSCFDLIVEYEHSSQEDKVEIERVLSGALQLGSSKLNETGIHLLQKGDSVRNESLRISIGGNLKKEVFLSNVSKKDISQFIVLIIANVFKVLSIK